MGTARVVQVGMLTGALVLVLSGCLGAFLDAGQIEALGKDPATVCITAPTPFGLARFARTNLANGRVICDADGMKVQSETPAR